MEDHDDWKLGDEGDATVCPGCGKPAAPPIADAALHTRPQIQP